MKEYDSDADVVRASLTEPEVFGLLFDRHFPAVYGFCVRRLGRGTGEDVAADVFRRAFESRSRYADERLDARPWLFAIAVNLVRGSLRASAVQTRATARLVRRHSTTTYDPIEGVAASVDAERRLVLVAEALRLLPISEVEPLLLYCWEGLSYAEIAEVVGIPVGTVRSRMSRVRQRLSSAVDADGPIGDVPTDRLGKLHG